MEIKNLTEENVDTLQDVVDKIRKENPNVTSRVFEMKEKKPDEVAKVSIMDLMEAIEQLDRKLDHIFGGHVLLNGEFIKPVIA
jgi:hypothetical protein